MTPVSMDGDGTLLDDQTIELRMKKQGVDGVNNNESWFRGFLICLEVLNDKTVYVASYTWLLKSSLLVIR